MELIIQTLILFIVINTVLKLSFWQWWQAALFGAVCAAFIVLTCPYAANQSKTQLADYLSNSRILQDMAVLITAESAICFGFCFIALREIWGRKVKYLGAFLRWYPGLLIFPALFYLQTQLFFGLPGVDFNVISYAMAGGVFLLLPLLAKAMRYLLEEKELRLEVFFLVSLFICIIGLISTVNGNVTYAATKEPLNVKAIALSTLLFAASFVIGFLWNKYKWILTDKKKKKNK